MAICENCGREYLTNDTDKSISIVPISTGTTRFQHDNKEYIRTFTTRLIKTKKTCDASLLYL